MHHVYIYISAVIAVLLAPVVNAGGQPAVRDWLDDKTWPQFLAHQPLDVKGEDDALVKLLKERYNAGQSELRSRYIHWLQTGGTLNEVFETASRVISARLEAEVPVVDRLALLKEKVEFARAVEKQAEISQKTFRKAERAIDLKCAIFFRLDAEVELLRAERAPKKSP